MDRHALAVLEFPAIVERLAGATESAYGETLARALEPSADPGDVARRQALTAEGIALLDNAAEPSLAGLADVRSAAEHAARDGMLGPRDLRHVAAAVAVALEARRVLGEARALAPSLRDLVEPVELSLSSLAEAIDHAVAEDGSDLRDTASPALRSLRSELRNGKQRVTEELGRVARSTELTEFLQERFVTERGGRPVLAVKTSARGKVPGVVHDSSSSGQTLFVEPFAIVELNNRLAEAASAEREEVERILRELSRQVGERAAELELLVEATGALDVVLASAALSRRWRGATVVVADRVRLLSARHPLLDQSTAVPIDLELDDLRVLVISGPNTGGKTVALKTLGLAAVLHQSGLRPPAVEATLPVFDEVLADVGDEQSIEMSLSTFSAHLRNIVAILEAATGRSLVLLDELAAGTDPVEGSALAQALLARLARQARLTLVTTHYPELKEWASATDRVANAATGFDPDTHAPLYRIAVGRPGTSHALQIAARLGLQADVVEDARSRIDPARLRTAALLAEAEEAEQRATAERAAAEAERVEAERLARQAGERGAQLQAETEKVRASAGAAREAALLQAERDLAEARAELDGLRAEIRVARRSERERQRHVSDPSVAEAERDRRLGAAAARGARTEQAIRALRPLTTTAPLAVGDPVEAPDAGVRGTIASIDGETAEVLGSSGFRLKIPLVRLRPSASRSEPAATPEPAVRVFAAARGDVSDQLDVRGMRAQEAREAVRAFVDDASLAGLKEVRVVHGRGTGALRTAVREELARHTLVDSQQLESSDGASVAQLG